jgi:sigma-B regulation protein RsbU (phosphoserine phosphatase)
VRFRERSELLDFLLEVSAVTAQTLDLDQLSAHVADIVHRVLPYDLFALLLYNDRRKDLRIRYAVGHREEVMRNLSIPLGQGITGAAAAQREPILVGDVRTDPRYLNTVDAVRTELAVPMTARGKLVGVIDLQSTRVKAYSEYDRALLRLIAARVAIAIDNARLYYRVERQNRTLKTLANISREFSSILDLNALLEKIINTMRDLIDYDAFSILLVDLEAKALRHLFSVRYDKRVNIDNVPLGKGLTGAAAESREVVRVHDTAKDPRYIASHPDIRSEIAVPLIVQDRVVGVMDLESERVGYFTEDHVRTLTLLAPQVASSVENARLYKQLADRQRVMDEDLHAARELQRVLLPDAEPEIEGDGIGRTAAARPRNFGRYL